MTISLTGNYDTLEVTMNGSTIDPAKSIKLRNHSPDGVSWGYNGSGPAQLSLAILLLLLPEAEALRKYQNFKFEVISHLPQTDFSVTVDMDNFKIIEGLPPRILTHE